MSRLDFEFEQVLGSWLDHCSDSLAALPASVQVDDALFLDAARSTALERFRGMIADNLEKLREIYRVLLARLRTKSNSSSGNNSNSGSGRNKLTVTGDEHLVFDTVRNELMNGSNLNNSGSINLLLASDGAVLSAGALFALSKVRQARQLQFLWLLLDSFMHAVPLAAATWCVANSSEFTHSLVLRCMPWDTLCDWCHGLVSGWVSLFEAVEQRFARDLKKAVTERRAAIVVAQNMAAERTARRLEEEASAATRAASAKEIAELQALSQRLVAALQRHKPSDGRTINVKLEPGLVKQEVARELLAGAAQLAGVGNTAENALDVDAEYEPTYVEGAQMSSLVKTDLGADAASDANNNGGAGGLGAKREPRKRRK